jgi:hypothetical protein
MLHPVFPTVLAGERLVAKATSAFFRWPAPDLPAALTYGIESFLELLSFLRRRGFSREPGVVHSTQVLGEKIFSIEVIRAPRVSAAAIMVLRLNLAGANVTSVESQLEVLRIKMALPLILGDKGTIASIVRKATHEVSCCSRIVRFGLGAGFSNSTSPKTTLASLLQYGLSTAISAWS